MLRILISFIIIIPIVLFGMKSVIQHLEVRVAGASTVEILSPLASITPKKSRLGEIVKGQLDGTKGTYGVAIIKFDDLDDNETYFMNEHRQFKSASLYKLWVMATAYDQITTGKLSEDTVLTQDLDILHNKFGLASVSAQTSTAASAEAPADAEAKADNAGERKKAVISLTVKEALSRMITISDNYSALLLSDKVKLVNVTAFLEKHGFTESHVGSKGKYPYTTASDMASFVHKLHSGELGDEESTEKMIALLKAQRLNGKLPKYLPKGTVMAHKTGELEEVTHDVGIVYAPGGTYIIAVLSESTSRVQAEERISLVSKAVWEYFASE